MTFCLYFFFFSSRRRHTRYWRDWSSDVCSSDLTDEYNSPRSKYWQRILQTVALEKEHDEATVSLKDAAPLGKWRFGVAALAGARLSLLAVVLYVLPLGPPVLPYSLPVLLHAAGPVARRV